MQETQVQSLSWEDPLEKEMAIHSSTLAWEIPWTEKPGGLQSMGSQRVGHDLVMKPPPPSSLYCRLKSQQDDSVAAPEKSTCEKVNAARKASMNHLFNLGADEDLAMDCHLLINLLLKNC